MKGEVGVTTSKGIGLLSVPPTVATMLCVPEGSNGVVMPMLLPDQELTTAFIPPMVTLEVPWDRPKLPPESVTTVPVAPLTGLKLPM